MRQLLAFGLDLVDNFGQILVGGSLKQSGLVHDLKGQPRYNGPLSVQLKVLPTHCLNLNLLAQRAN